MKPEHLAQELLIRVPTFNYDIATKLAKFIIGTYWNNWKWMDAGIFIEECIRGIEQGEETFDETKGSILPYMKQRIRYVLQQYLLKINKSNVQQIGNSTITYEEEEEEEPIDLSMYTDREIEALFKVMHGKPSSIDKKIVKDLF